ncbi:DUF262 domain-containing protein [Mucilaginibacter flavidus]|uniref:DUF262 domain-containing protein n=1 Tax=Mucilaginibacter flavidus TaxID=2949309 RepID=UPI00209260BE|nr:DUF262 domain-containing protein [Mucilaginibacter flavidus]MCO5949920.1 DUF262 domain-containing protein [Mucilaginibacter flavidus]
MKNFDSRTYSVNDFLEWFDNKQLELNPKFQRRSVWTDIARSYLMDTIVRGKPIPKVFIRQKLNIQTRQSVREVVDGQQRLKTILSFLKDGFKINKKHHTVYGGLYFSQLNTVDENIQTNILNYEISTDLLVNMPDSEVLDIFSRLNSYSVTLNEQEKINANHFGPFKTLADRLAHVFNQFWIDNKILKEPEILRMGDVTLVADLLIAMIEGIKSKKQIKNYYDQYEKDFEYDVETLETNFAETLSAISDIFRDELKNSELRRIHLFYSLFTTIYHCKFGLPNFDGPRPDDSITYTKIASRLDTINSLFEADSFIFTPNEARFLEDSRRATTDTNVRLRRTEYMINLIIN